MLAGWMTDSMEEVDTALQLGGLLFGGMGTAIDAIGASQSEGCGL